MTNELYSGFKEGLEPSILRKARQHRQPWHQQREEEVRQRYQHNVKKEKISSVKEKPHCDHSWRYVHVQFFRGKLLNRLPKTSVNEGNLKKKDKLSRFHNIWKRGKARFVQSQIGCHNSRQRCRNSLDAFINLALLVSWLPMLTSFTQNWRLKAFFKARIKFICHNRLIVFIEEAGHLKGNIFIYRSALQNFGYRRVHDVV